MHWIAEAQASDDAGPRCAIPRQLLAVSITVTVGAELEPGSKVTASLSHDLPLKIAVHWVLVGQAMSVGSTPMLSVLVRTRAGARGSKVTLVKPPDVKEPDSVAVHCATVGQATALRANPGAIAPLLAAPGAAGSNVTSRPEESTAVHWFAAGQATSVSARLLVWSTACGAAQSTVAADAAAVPQPANAPRAISAATIV